MVEKIAVLNPELAEVTTSVAAEETLTITENHNALVKDTDVPFILEDWTVTVDAGQIVSDEVTVIHEMETLIDQHFSEVEALAFMDMEVTVTDESEESDQERSTVVMDMATTVTTSIVTSPCAPVPVDEAYVEMPMTTSIEVEI